MGKKLAIKGHPTRGKEVIGLLEMMGGHNSSNLLGNKSDYAYFITDSGDIGCRDTNHILIDCFTFEEFLEKYPFKIRDKVLIPEYESEVRICKMRWDPLCEYMEYMVYRNEDQEWYTAEELLNYNDNPTQCLDTECCINNTTKSLDDIYSITRCKTTGQGTYAIKIADGYRFDSIDENGNIIVKSIKPKYPTTYDDCCDMLNADLFAGYELMINFPKLINARNAYWKIAGEEMGLSKPWEPDWMDETAKYGIRTYQNTVIKDNIIRTNCILAFPTPEMRNIFYENFKDLIEACKELL